MKRLLSQVTLLWLCCGGEVLAAPLRLSYLVVGPTVAGAGDGAGVLRRMAPAKH